MNDPIKGIPAKEFVEDFKASHPKEWLDAVKRNEDRLPSPMLCSNCGAIFQRNERHSCGLG